MDYKIKNTYAIVTMQPGVELFFCLIWYAHPSRMAHISGQVRITVRFVIEWYSDKLLTRTSEVRIFQIISDFGKENLEDSGRYFSRCSA